MRVDGSRNTLTMVRPRRVGTFLMERDAISRKPSLSLNRVSMSAVDEIVDGDEVHVGTLSASLDTFKRFAFSPDCIAAPGGDSKRGL